MKFTLDLACDNAAFDLEPASEIARILRRVADGVERDGETEGTLYDMNGNRVGAWKVS